MEDMHYDYFISEEKPADYDYEKASYQKAAYRRVRRLRKRGERRGIDVPRLNYILTQPEKPRVAFRVMAIVSAVLFAAVIAGLILFYNELVKIFSDLNGLGDFIKVVFRPDILSGSLGLSALPGLLMAAVYVLIAVLFALPIIAAVYFYRFVRDAFYMSKCSKEEFAKGGIISSRIFVTVTVLIVSTVLFAVLLVYVKAAEAKLYTGLIYAGLALALGGLLIMMIAEKVKANKWFSCLDENLKQNYLAHERALRRVKSRLGMEKRLWNDLGK